MIKASLRGHYDADMSGVVAVLAADSGDVKFQASMTDATFGNSTSLDGLSLSVEKPRSFIVDYEIPKKDMCFQFMNSVRVLEKQLNLTYTHQRGENRTALDSTLVIDPANKLSANYAFDSGNCKLKYSYAHPGLATFEPCYDFDKNSWDLAVSKRVYGDLIKTYQTSNRNLGIDIFGLSLLENLIIGTFC